MKFSISFLKNKFKGLLLRFTQLAMVKEISLTLFLKKNFASINDEKNRYLRANILRYYSDKLKKKMEQINFKQGLLIFEDKVYAFSEGIFLNTAGTNRYFKISNCLAGNEGKIIYDFLKSQKISLNNMVDLGANFGEISLYFCRQNPKMKILAVEPSTENFQILKTNCQFQNFSTDNIILVNEAVSNYQGEMEISLGLGSENSVIFNQGAKKEIVKTDTLLSLLERFGFKTVDFLKIDIEGAEPLLYDSLKKIIGCIKSILLEVGGKSADYTPLLRLLWDSGRKCYLRDDNFKKVDSFENLIKLLNGHSLDLLFIKD